MYSLLVTAASLVYGLMLHRFVQVTALLRFMGFLMDTGFLTGPIFTGFPWWYWLSNWFFLYGFSLGVFSVRSTVYLQVTAASMVYGLNDYRVSYGVSYVLFSPRVSEGFFLSLQRTVYL